MTIGILTPPATSCAHTTLATPVGVLTLVASGRGLRAVLWEHERPGRVRGERGVRDDSHPLLRQAASQLEEYFAGSRQEFALPLDPVGTPFQLSVWQALRTIPYGETRSYTDVARQIGRAGAVRAVGAANGRNPLSIIAPCHRVVGASGALTGFAAGLEAKALLLAHERRAKS